MGRRGRRGPRRRRSGRRARRRRASEGTGTWGPPWLRAADWRRLAPRRDPPGRGSRGPGGSVGPEDLADQVGGRLLELVVPAVRRLLVRSPALERRAVA